MSWGRKTKLVFAPCGHEELRKERVFLQASLCRAVACPSALNELAFFRPDVSAHLFLHGESETPRKILSCSFLVKRWHEGFAYCVASLGT